MDNLKDYFKYHPPTTQKRKDLHEKVNELSFMACEQLMKAKGDTTVDALCDRFLENLKATFENVICQKWLDNSIGFLRDSALAVDEEAILMYIQQARMFTNQGITIDELDFIRETESVNLDESSSEEHF